MQSLSLRTDKPLDPNKFLPWLQNLVAQEGAEDPALQGHPRLQGRSTDRYVFQGVHMMLEGDHQRDWQAGEPRESRLVFIGRELPEQTIREGFRELYRRVMTAVRCRGMTARPCSVAVGCAACRGRHARWSAHFLGDIAVFVAGEEALLFVHRTVSLERSRSMAVESCARASDGQRIVTGGDDGKVWRPAPRRGLAGGDRCQAALDRSCRAAVPTARWRGRPARTPSSAARKGEGEAASTCPRPSAGSRSRPRGCALAVAHYNGVTLWFPNMAGDAGTSGMGGLASRCRSSVPTTSFW